MRRSPIRRRNPERRARLHARNFGDHADAIRAMRCCGCGRRPPSAAAHSVGRKMGGCGGDRRDLVPLCDSDPATGWVGCHYLYDEDTDAFTDRTGLARDDVRAIAAELWAQGAEGAGPRPPTNPRGKGTEK
ncbi:MAG: hypothetical protein LC798_13600 [Chloroflexi bacterium]|nr:hypothetical protein [Chloroflexota bacterium]